MLQARQSQISTVLDLSTNELQSASFRCAACIIKERSQKTPFCTEFAYSFYVPLTLYPPKSCCALIQKLEQNTLDNKHHNVTHEVPYEVSMPFHSVSQEGNITLEEVMSRQKAEMDRKGAVRQLIEQRKALEAARLAEQQEAQAQRSAPNNQGQIGTAQIAGLKGCMGLMGGDKACFNWPAKNCTNHACGGCCKSYLNVCNRHRILRGPAEWRAVRNYLA
jgi:hypothetical protein